LKTKSKNFKDNDDFLIVPSHKKSKVDWKIFITNQAS